MTRPAGREMPGDDRDIHRSKLAGTWYPDEPETLRAQLAAMLGAARRNATVAALSAARHAVRALVLPHAGMSWSGPTAAHGCALLADTPIDRVILLGTAHRLRFRGVSVHRVAAYETPLGRVPVDWFAVESLLEVPDFKHLPEAHADEHSLEIELPFLQCVLGPEFRLVPALVSEVADDRLPPIAAALRSLVDEHTLCVASSDFTHFGDGFGYKPFAVDAQTGEQLRALDRGAIDAILARDRERFDAYCRRTGITICGQQPIRLLLELLGSKGEEVLESSLLDYTTSGAMSGDYAHSVSYAAIAFLAPGADRLSPGQCATLLSLARRTIASAARESQTFRLDEVALPDDATFARSRAVFVTLRIDGELRGCIGTIAPLRPLAAAVAHAAWSAAFEDPRFSPLQPLELERVQIEISVLSPLSPVDSPEQILPGRDGVLLTRGERRGVFLPQVAEEQGWDRETFLSRLAVKAGLEASPWIADAVYQRFQVQMMEEDARAQHDS